MNGKKISQLEEKLELLGTEFIPIQDGSENKRIKVDKLATKKDIGDINKILDNINGEVI